jgi:putative membrane protein
VKAPGWAAGAVRELVHGEERVPAARRPGDAAGGPRADADGWQRLDPRTYVVTALVVTGVVISAGVPTALGITSGMGAWAAAAWTVGGALLCVGLGTGLDYVRWRRTRYRIGPERAELRTGLFLVKSRVLARERIRTVDLTANLMLRLLGLVTVRIGTGEHTGDSSTLELESVRRAEGERLRTLLLAHTPPRPGTHREGTLASLDVGWIRFAPMSFLSPVLGGAAVGAVLQISDWFGAQQDVIRWVARRFEDIPLGWAVLASVAAACAAGMVAAVGLWVEMWWNYRLEREPGGTLRVRRGLFTSRSVSLEERRLRGVELVEPLGVRLLGGARLDAVATGLVKRAEHEKHVDHKNLLPAVPRDTADTVAAQVLRENAAPTAATRLVAHPPAARRRRLRWALAAALLPAAVSAALGAWLTGVLLWAAVCVAAAGTAIGLPLALSAYRALGHGLGGAYLVARSGVFSRTTVALQRTGVVGWRVRQSVFQRRAGLVSLTATTAAGRGAYHVRDAAEAEALLFAEEAVPGLLAPFLEHGPAGAEDDGRRRGLPSRRRPV